jgi:hypothetical protein
MLSVGAKEFYTNLALLELEIELTYYELITNSKNPCQNNLVIGSNS